jgi:GNAT superfamily N-acetyltransferase
VIERAVGVVAGERKLAPIKQLTSDQLAYFTELDHRDHEALVAVTPSGRIVGVARYIRFGKGSTGAEVAVTVADEWQQRRVGYALLRALAHHPETTAAHLRAAGKAARSVTG